ncbi:MAG: glycosyltransferase [Chthoniobacterales bacterium]|nr:glycosyltransferase [Chthoniobacterales bacterium]
MNNGNGMERRVLLFSHETTLSGAPLALFHLACWLADQGTPPVAAAPEAGPISELLASRGIEVILDGSFLTDLKRTKLEALCSGFEIIVANTLASWPVIRAARSAGRCAIWYLHETLFAIELTQKISQIQPTLELADLLITPTRQTARLYEGVTRSRIEVVPYGIPEIEIKPRATSGDPWKFLCLGSYESRKGQDVLLDAISRLRADVRERTSFTFAGRVLESAFFEKLQARAAQLENVHLRPALDHGGSLQLIAQSDVLVCASRDETMPISIIEAMSLGQAVISADVGGIAEWLRDGMNGWLVPADDAEALAEAIANCAENRGRVKVFGEAARRTFARHFTLDHFGRRFAAGIEGAARRRASPPKPEKRSYGQWVTRYDTFGGSDRIELRRRLRASRRQPLISLLLPIYNPDLQLLAAAIDSVKSQVYRRWELCLADDASTDPAVRPFLEASATSDPRIRVTFRETNGHISAASNSALALAAGEWCALLDQDDLLTEDALGWVALEIAEHPNARVIYSDEDKIDLGGVRSNPFFKTDWNPELFLGQNYINHLGVYETALLRFVGAFREGYDGSQDYDVALRCCEKLRPEQVRHIPRILYHWRMAPGSLAEVPDAKPYAKEAARRALTDHLRRQGIAGRVEACPENKESHRVIYEVPNPAPLVTIIIPTRDRATLLHRCIESLREVTDYPSFEILVVDNSSREKETLDYLRGLEVEAKARVLRDDGPFNFSRLNNLAAAQARDEILAFLNNDIQVTERGWLTEMVSHAARPDVGAVGARLWYADGTLQHGGVVLGLGGIAGHAHYRVPRGHPGYFNRAILQQNCSAVTAACMVTRRTVFRDIGGFDERTFAVSYNDIDFCLRLSQRGLRMVWTPYANLIHDESASRGRERTAEAQAQFFREAVSLQKKWGAQLLSDPFYNPNFSLNLPGFEIAFPRRRIAI